LIEGLKGANTFQRSLLVERKGLPIKHLRKECFKKGRFWKREYFGEKFFLRIFKRWGLKFFGKGGGPLSPFSQGRKGGIGIFKRGFLIYRIFPLKNMGFFKKGGFFPFLKGSLFWRPSG